MDQYESFGSIADSQWRCVVALAFRVISFEIENGSCKDGVTRKEKFTFPGKIRRDFDDNLVVDAALKSFAFEYGSTPEYVLGREEVTVSVEQSGHQSGQVTLHIKLRPGNPDQNWKFKGSAEVLVIADLE
ncbi:hypothetical protein J7I98_40130 [Streptomyces sp. ISL-98]|uniref:hypothetical protein n=1 Tax=Streptomyces sp. ISL-98 TaxID=2819192 RepID=UPI001BEABA1A|nr:hypothetical protein [Streptomyces sp. ISL-98]MBT2511858.1 hypothetical protein [Streptomyces sp. ISL-98]